MLTPALCKASAMVCKSPGRSWVRTSRIVIVSLLTSSTRTFVCTAGAAELAQLALRRRFCTRRCGSSAPESSRSRSPRAASQRACEGAAPPDSRTTNVSKAMPLASEFTSAPRMSMPFAASAAVKMESRPGRSVASRVRSAADGGAVQLGREPGLSRPCPQLEVPRGRLRQGGGQVPLGQLPYELRREFRLIACQGSVPIAEPLPPGFDRLGVLRSAQPLREHGGVRLLVERTKHVPL